MINPDYGKYAQTDQILSAMPDIVVIYDRHGRILYANRQYAEMLGLTQADIIGKTLRELGRPKEVYESIEAQIKEILTSGKALTSEQDVPLPAGVRHFEYIVAPLFREDGSVASVVVTSRDVTERRRAEEDVKESRRQVLDILESISDGFFALDSLWRVTYINGRAQQLLGFRKEYILFKSLWEKLPNAQVLRLYKELNQAAETKSATSFDEFIPSFDKWFEFHVYPYENGMSVYFSDITSKKQAEEALRESEERVRRKLDSILSPKSDIGKLELEDIIDAPALQALVDDLYKLANLPIGIIDLKGKVLVGVGWQDICTKFHRAHPDTCRHCMESDLELTKGIPAGEFKLYKCKNNMWDAATPIIVGGQHMGNIFWGQFFFDDETIDREFFRAQARKYAFDEEEYLAALESVPRIRREDLSTGMDFYLKLANMISNLSYSNIKLARYSAERDTLMASLQESEERYHLLFENMLGGFAYCKMLFNEEGRPIDFIYLAVNDAFEKLTGLKNVTGRRVTEVIPGIKEAEPELFEVYGRVALTGEPEEFEIDFKPLGMWFSISVYSPQREHFVAVFDNITERKRAENVVQARLRMLVAAANLSLDEMLQMALDEIEAQTNSVIGFYHFLQDDQETLSLQNWSTNTLKNMCTAEGKGSHYPVSQAGVWVDAVRERRPVIHNDFASLPHRKGMPEGHAPVIREMIIPIMREDRIVAIIGMGNKPTDYNEADIEIASLLGDFSWEIVERKRAEEVLAESKRLSDALNEINASISSTLDFDEIMQRIIDEAATAIGTETGAIIFREGDHWLTKYSYGYEENIVGVILTDKEAPHAALAAKLKKPVVINDAYNDPGVNLEIMKRYSIRSVITVPLIARGTTIGILFLNYHTAPVAFTEAQIDFASKLSVSISLAIENARLYEAERNIADSLQSALIKIPEHIEGVEYGYLYRSATEATKVGGDFFDIFELEHDKVGIMVGDVSGKGLEAASITSLVRNTVRAYAYEEESPAVIMAKTNDAVKKSTPASYFVTLFLGIVDMKSGALTYCSAGHPPALLKRKTSGVVLLDVGSPILGAFAGLSYDDGSATIEEGDILVLYTDGVTEARCNGGFFGDERLVAFLETLQGVSAKDTSQVVFSEVMSCTGGELSDDVVLFSFSLGAEVRHNA